MRFEARLFLLVAGFLFGCAVVYAWGTDYASHGHVEMAGTTALVLSGGLALIIGSYFWFVARRIDLRPEDRHDAEIAEGAGELGFFSPHSYWPLGIGLSATIAGIALVFLQVWLLLVGVACILATTGGLLFEYYTRGHSSPSM